MRPRQQHYPERRKHPRILTLKNFRNAMLALVAIFAVLTIRAHLRGPKAEDGFGRLYANQVPAAQVTKSADPIQSGQIDDATAADPMLVGAQARAQILTGESDPQRVISTEPSAEVRAPLLNKETAGKLVVVGGPEGVKIVRTDVAQPELGGGFGKQ